MHLRNPFVRGSAATTTHAPGVRMAIVDFGGTGVEPKTLPPMALALTKQAQQHFALPPPWGYGISATVRVASGPHDVQPDEWVIGLLAQPDQPGALGYHDQTPAGEPFIRVFPLLDQQDGGQLSVTISHEICEALADPNGAKCAQWSDGKIYAYETCLVGATRVRLGSGELVPIETLASRGGFFDVRALDASGQPAAARAGHARLTARSADTVIVQMSDATTVRCTPEHRFLLADGTYRPAKELRSGTLLWADTLPCITSARPVDRAQAHGEAPGQDFGAFGRLADEQDVGFGELGGVHVLAVVTASRHSALGRRVEHVLVVGSKKQVIGSDARANVAAMADFDALRNRAPVDFVRHAVGESQPVLVAYVAVAGGALRASPKPAAFGLVHARPEALFDGRRPVVVGGKSSVEPSVSMLAAPVGGAQSLGAQRTRAVGNGACSHTKTVVTVEPAGKADVYDLTVPKHRNFAIGAGVFVHNCDACEAYSYVIDGVKVSDFCLPPYFEPMTARAGLRYDWMGLITKPLQILPGGYAQWFEAGTGWQMIQHAVQAPRLYRLRDHSRPAKRKAGALTQSQPQPRQPQGD